MPVIKHLQRAVMGGDLEKLGMVMGRDEICMG